MPQFRKKPTIVEAEQWYPWRHVEGVIVPVPGGRTAYVETLEGRMKVCPGDWIVTGPAGQRYPVKPETFEATFEPLRERRRVQSRA